MDNIFKSIRTLLGYQAEVSESAIDILDGVNIEYDVVQEKIEKAMQDFDHANDSLSLKISACDMLIEKGNSVGADNKGYLVDKLNRVTTQYHEEVSKLVEEKKEIEGRKVELESDIITKSVQIVSALNKDNQLAIKDILDAWNETGLIKGEEVEDQLRAMTLAIDEIVKGGQGSGEGSRGGKVIGHTRSGKPIYSRLSGSKVSYPNFNSRDHSDAAKAHAKFADESESDTNKFWHSKKSDEHLSHVQETVEKAESELNPFEAEEGSFFFEGPSTSRGG